MKFESVYGLPFLGPYYNPTATVIATVIVSETKREVANESFDHSVGRTLRACSTVAATDGSRAMKAMQRVSRCVRHIGLSHLLRGTVESDLTRKSPILPVPSTEDFQKCLRCRHYPSVYP